MRESSIMKRLGVLTAIAIVLVSTTGCGCIRNVWRGVRECVHGSPVETCYDTCMPGCPGGCMDVAGTVGSPYVQPVPSYDNPGATLVPEDGYGGSPTNANPNSLNTPSSDNLRNVPNGV